jgi:hypothetical protein
MQPSRVTLPDSFYGNRKNSFLINDLMAIINDKRSYPAQCNVTVATPKNTTDKLGRDAIAHKNLFEIR